VARTRRERTYRPMGDRVRPLGEVLDGELGLIAAVLRQVVEDSQRPQAPYYAEVEAFLTDASLLQGWCALVDVDAQAFAAYVRRARGQG